MMNTRYDLIVVGTEPEGLNAAVAASIRNKRVLVIEPMEGDQFDSGILEVLRSRLHSVADSHLDTGDWESPSIMQQIRSWRTQLTSTNAASVRREMARNGIDLRQGDVHFVDADLVDVTNTDECLQFEADFFVLAVGARTRHPLSITFDDRVKDFEQSLSFETPPDSMVVVGANAKGLNVAMLYATLGTEVTVVDERERLADSVEGSVTGQTLLAARSLGVQFEMSDEVIGVNHVRDSELFVHLLGGHVLKTHAVVYCADGLGNADGLNLEQIGVVPDERSRLWTNADQRTWVEHIYAVGEVVGFPPAITQESSDQGERAVRHMFGHEVVPHHHFEWKAFAIQPLSDALREAV